MELRAERALPSGVTGPVERAELAAEASLPAWVTGPRDLAPLARAAAMRASELMFSFPDCSVADGGAGIGDGRGEVIDLIEAIFFEIV